MKNFGGKFRVVLETITDVVIIVGLVIIIQTWLIAPFEISGASMCDTLNNINGQCVNDTGERIIINEALYLAKDPERGDVVVFKTGDSDKYFIKRVIGLPGETVEIHNGNVYITNETDGTFELEEEYLNQENRGNTETFFSDMTVFEIPADHYFMMGDNRRASTDSRSCFQSRISSSCTEHPELSFVSRDTIRGKAWFVWWPLGNFRLLQEPAYANSDSLEEK